MIYVRYVNRTPLFYASDLSRSSFLFSIAQLDRNQYFPRNPADALWGAFQHSIPRTVLARSCRALIVPHYMMMACCYIKQAVDQVSGNGRWTYCEWGKWGKHGCVLCMTLVQPRSQRLSDISVCGHGRPARQRREGEGTDHAQAGTAGGRRLGSGLSIGQQWAWGLALMTATRSALHPRISKGPI